jgi:hypothetical protein
MVEGSTFRSNASLNAAGGGLALRGESTLPSQISNAVFFGNTAVLGGDSVYVNGTAPVDILHTTLAGTGAVSEQGITVAGADVQITNAILISHTVGIAASGGAVVTTDHTLFHSNQTDVQGVTNQNPVYGDPRFMNVSTGDFHLTLGSPAIDAGVATSIATDFEADLRPIIAQSDLGADEFGDSAVGDPGGTTTVGGGGITITIPPGAMGGPGNILFLPTFPPTFLPPTPWLPISPGFQLLNTPAVALHELRAALPAGDFLLPITVTLTYNDSALAGIDESTLFLALYDASTGQWVEATATCPESGTVIHNLDENQITVTTCASGEFAVLGLDAAGAYPLYLPILIR